MDVFQLKDLERLGPTKGIVAQTVKEVLQTLVDDSLVTTEKIGISNFFWSFPGQTCALLKQRHLDLKAELDLLQNNVESSNLEIKKASELRLPNEERESLLQQLETSKQQQKELKEKLLQYKDYDPVEFKHLEQKAKVCQESAERWMDNLSLLEDYCCLNFGIERQNFTKMLE